MAQTAWQISRKKYPYFSTKQKNSLNILCLFCRIETIALFFYQAKTLLKYTGLLCRIEEINFLLFYQAKKPLNILGLFCRIEKINISIFPPSIKNSFSLMAHY